MSAESRRVPGDFRVVLDTRILILSLLFPRSAAGQCVAQLARVSATPLFCDSSFAELAARAGQPDLDGYRSRAQLDKWLTALARCALWLAPAERVDVCVKARHNQLLALAVCGEADSIITSEPELLALRPFEGIPITGPAAWLATWRAARGR